jgi:hypothetical protein
MCLLPGPCRKARWQSAGATGNTKRDPSTPLRSARDDNVKQQQHQKRRQIPRRCADELRSPAALARNDSEMRKRKTPGGQSALLETHPSKVTQGGAPTRCRNGRGEVQTEERSLELHRADARGGSDQGAWERRTLLRNEACGTHGIGEAARGLVV